MQLTRSIPVLLLLALAACSGGSEAADTTTTVAAITTTEEPSTTVAETTVEGPVLSWSPPSTVEMSRETREALVRCAEQVEYFFVESVLDDRGYLTETIDLCDEAKLQVEVDGGRPQLNLLLADLNLALSFANLRIVSGQFDIEAQDSLTTAVMTFGFQLTSEMD